MNNTFIKILKIILIKFIDLNKQQIINFLKKSYASNKPEVLFAIFSSRDTFGAGQGGQVEFYC